MSTNLKTVQSIYEAFQRGDIPGLMNHLAESVAWEAWPDNRAQAAGVPWMKARTRKAEVWDFFDLVGRFHIHDFRVQKLLDGGDQVAAAFTIDATPPGGTRYQDEEIHLWTFDGEGKVVGLRHYLDTAKHIAAANLGVDSPRVAVDVRG